MSRGCIARWMLEEIGRPYETVLLDFATTLKAPAYLAINPMGKVPPCLPARRRAGRRRNAKTAVGWGALPHPTIPVSWFFRMAKTTPPTRYALA